MGLERGWITELGLVERGETRWLEARSGLRDFILQEELLSRLCFLCSSKISSSTEKQERHPMKDPGKISAQTCNSCDLTKIVVLGSVVFVVAALKLDSLLH